MKNNSVHSCQFVHLAKFHCFILTLNKLFKNEIEKGEIGNDEPKPIIVKTQKPKGVELEKSHE